MVKLKPFLLGMVAMLLFPVTSRAAIFMVTSNADSGPGTFRQALTDAAADVSSLPNHINFNLPAGQQSINVPTALPAITSSLIIDGTTQPGTALGPNGAKITLIGPGNGTQFNCLEIHDAADVEIYGLVIKEFYQINSGGLLTGSSAIALMGTSSKIIIGAPGKGNVMYDDGSGIVNTPVAGFTINIAYCEIKSNYIGTREDGQSFSGNEGNSIVLSYTHQSQIGGATAAEGNTMIGNFTISPYFDGTTHTLGNNIFGLSGLYITPAGFDPNNSQVYLSSNITNAIQTTSFLLSNNIFGSTLSASGFKNINLTVQGNYWGQSPNGKSNVKIPGPAITLTNLSGTILIGGSNVADGNTITNTITDPTEIQNGDAVVESLNSSTVELSHNSFFCNNGLPFAYMNTTIANQPMFVKLNAVNGAGASGTTKPNARVELFYTDKECTGCEPEKYIASVNADASGNWAYTGAIDAGFNLIAGATLNKISSEFSEPQFDASKLATHDVDCITNGSITGIQLTNSNIAQWYTEGGVPAGPPGPDLTNAAAGGYYLQLSQFGCILRTPVYIIHDNRPVLDQSGENTANTTCGLANGSITGLKPANYQSMQWLDANGNIIPNATKPDLTGVAAGAYTIRLFNVNCSLDFGPFTVGSTPDAITISTVSAQNTPDQCGQGLGSITNVPISGGVAPLKYTWTNTNGKVVSTTANATGLTAGAYILTVTDASCAMATQTFNITEQNGVLNPPQANNIKICGNAAILTVNNTQSGYSYKLYSDNVSPVPLQTNSNGIFNVNVPANTSFYISQALGTCESTRTQVSVTHSNDFGAIPNTFSPNGDGINDYWQIDGLNAYPEAHLQIFNRYGQELYQSKGYSIPWDGTYKGSPLPSGTYYYIITLGPGTCSILSGYVAIVR